MVVIPLSTLYGMFVFVLINICVCNLHIYIFTVSLLFKTTVVRACAVRLPWAFILALTADGIKKAVDSRHSCVSCLFYTRHCYFHLKNTCQLNPNEVLFKLKVHSQSILVTFLIRAWFPSIWKSTFQFLKAVVMFALLHTILAVDLYAGTKIVSGGTPVFPPLKAGHHLPT